MDASGAVRTTLVGALTANVTVLNPSLTVDDGGGSLTVDGTVAVSNFPAVQPVSDNGASLTVDDGGGSLTVDGTVAVSNFPSTQAVSFDDVLVRDAAGRYRVSDVTCVQQITTRNQMDPIFLQSAISGTGVAPAYSSAKKSVNVQLNAGIGSSRLTSTNYVTPEPGCSYLYALTFQMANFDSGKYHIGWFDSVTANGFYFSVSNGQVYFELSLAENASASVLLAQQASWNLDKLNGTGTSGYTLDLFSQITVLFDMSYGIGGPVRFGFMIQGKPTWCHVYTRNNRPASLRGDTFVLPMYFRNWSTSATSSTTNIHFFECSVMREGLKTPVCKTIFSYGTQPQTTATGASHLVSFRPKTTVNGIINRAQMIPAVLNMTAITVPCYIRVVMGATYSVAPTWVDADSGRVQTSSFQIGTAATFDYSTGIMIGEFVCGVNSAFTIDLEKLYDVSNFPPVTLDHDGNQVNRGILGISKQSTSSTGLIDMTISWKEY